MTTRLLRITSRPRPEAPPFDRIEAIYQEFRPREIALGVDSIPPRFRAAIVGLFHHRAASRAAIRPAVALGDRLGLGLEDLAGRARLRDALEAAYARGFYTALSSPQGLGQGRTHHSRGCTCLSCTPGGFAE